MASNVILIQTTVPNRESADRLVNVLIERRLAACVSVSSEVVSHYFWEEKVCNDKEFVLTIKTETYLYDAVEQALLRYHPYEVPEILSLPVLKGFEPYLKWVHDETRGGDEKTKTEIENKTDMESKMIQVGSPAPSFKLQGVMTDGSFKDVQLEDFKGKWTVVFFYPLDFTFVCPTEITSFSQKYEEFQKLNADVVGISVDSVFSHLAWINSDLGKINYPLLSDIKKETSRDYGVLLEEAGIALRGTFIIDPEGILKWQVVHDTGTGRSTDEVLRVLQALQTGDLCPANWKEGENTLGKA